MISNLERLLRQPHVWDVLRSLPGLAAGAVPADAVPANAGVRSAVLLLRAVSRYVRKGSTADPGGAGVSSFLVGKSQSLSRRYETENPGCSGWDAGVSACPSRGCRV